MKIRGKNDGTEHAGINGANKIWMISVFFMILGLALFIVGFATPRFGQINDGTDPGEKWNVSFPVVKVDSYFGLWQYCHEVKVNDSYIIQSKCFNVNDDRVWKPAAKAMNAVGLIFAVVGLFTSVLAGSWQSSKLMAMGGVLVLIGAITAAIGSAVFIGEYKATDRRIDAGYSVYFSLIGCASLIIGGGAQLMAIPSEYTPIV